MIEEERLEYVGAMILGLNDALVELSGSLAGFTLALQDSKLVAMVGMITGIAAALSMAVPATWQARRKNEQVTNKIGTLHRNSLYFYSDHPDSALPADFECPDRPGGYDM
jgi:VIT1/CCC1 family predicted Fe2+/Mn2+ transporter